MTALIAKQCYLPAAPKAVFQNTQGTAPGVLYEITLGLRKKWALVLPGPPRELEPLFLEQALPSFLRLAKLPPQSFLIRSLRIADTPESRVAQKITDILKWRPPLTVGIYAKPGQVELKIMAKDKSAKKALRMIGSAEKLLRKRLGTAVYGIDGDSLSSSLGALLRKKKQTLSAAESCTGGLLGHLLTETPGSSDYFKGGLTCYHNSAKTKLLGITPEILKKHGAVSAPVAKQMARNVRKLFGTTFGIGITGVAGPGGGSKQKPAGLVYIAFADPKKTACEKYLFFGGRSQIKLRAAEKALNRLRLRLI